MKDRLNCLPVLILIATLCTPSMSSAGLGQKSSDDDWQEPFATMTTYTKCAKKKNGDYKCQGYEKGKEGYGQDCCNAACEILGLDNSDPDFDLDLSELCKTAFNQPTDTPAGLACGMPAWPSGHPQLFDANVRCGARD